MDNIGYAVFGRPKGLETISNGLFKTLNLDSLLYLSDADVILNPGESTILIKRIPTDLSNLEKKDGILVAMFEQAYQHIENRPGGFVGSAICFKAFQPNAPKMIKGLFALFNEIRTQVGEDGKFRSSNAADWNINLPNSSKNFGFLSDKPLVYAPLHSKVKKHAVEVNSIKNYAVGILENAILNWSFHHVENIYIASQDSVLNNLVSHGAKRTDYAQFFDFSEQSVHYNSEMRKHLKEVSDAKSTKNQIEIDSKAKESNILNLENTLSNLKTEKEKQEGQKIKFESEIDRIKSEHNTWSEKEDQHRKEIRSLESIKSKIELENRKLEKQEISSNQNDSKLNFGESVAPKSNSFNITLVILTIGLMSLAFYFGYSFGTPNEESVVEQLAPVAVIEKESIEYKHLWEIDSLGKPELLYQSNLNLLIQAEGLSNSENDSIIKYPSNCYSKFPNNINVINFLNNRYLIPAEDVVPGYIQNKYKQKTEEERLNFLIMDYKSDSTSLYYSIPEKEEGNVSPNIFLEHFKWMIETNNPDIKWLEADSIKIPIVKKEK